MSERIAEVQRAFTNNGMKVLGAVWASPRAIDFALVGPRKVNSVVRYTNSPQQGDILELATMIAEGDFTRAFIVYTAEDHPHFAGEIEAFPLSRIDELAALLSTESAP